MVQDTFFFRQHFLVMLYSGAKTAILCGLH